MFNCVDNDNTQKTIAYILVIIHSVQTFTLYRLMIDIVVELTFKGLKLYIVKFLALTLLYQL